MYIFQTALLWRRLRKYGVRTVFMCWTMC